MNKIFLVLIVASLVAPSIAQKPSSQNVILVTLDGMRWQEIFRGADSSFFRQQDHQKDPQLMSKYWRDDLDERRNALMPFLWKTVAKEGLIIGNRDKKSFMNVTNQMWFSYPGYNELLTGKADDERIASNDAFYNPNTTVLEVINGQDGFKGKVTAFTSWDNFGYIINDRRSGVMVSSGMIPAPNSKITEAEKTMNKLMASLPSHDGATRADAFTFYYGLEYIKKNKPSVIYFSFDETDHFAHSGEYAAYLNSAHHTDALLSELWSYLQSDAHYKGKTTLIITVDHGRGPDAEGWKHHGKKTAGSDEVWMACAGAGVERLGESFNSEPVYQNQIASTIAALLGVPFKTTGTPIDLKK